MSEITLSTDLLRMPSFLKGAARVVDLRGKLDSYRTRPEKKADSECLKRDWATTGKDIANAFQENEQEA